MLLLCDNINSSANYIFYLTKKNNQPENGSQLELKNVVESNNVRIHLNEIINWFVFDDILLVIYNSKQHNGDVSPESWYRKFYKTLSSLFNL
jgi:hypothetical protein